MTHEPDRLSDFKPIMWYGALGSGVFDQELFGQGLAEGWIRFEDFEEDDDE